MIPKIIHYCWFGGNPLPELAQKCIESWKKFCPDYKIMRWDETNYDVNKNKYMKEAYDAQKWGFVPDYARLDIIYSYGGIYLDTDVEIVKSMDDLLNLKAFCGIESPSNMIALGLGFGAEKGNRILQLLRDDYENRRFVLGDGKLNLLAAPMTNTKKLGELGCNCDTDTVTKFSYNNSELCIFPKNYFCPKDYVTGEINMTKDTYTIHHYDGSWVSEEWRWCSTFIHKYHKYMGRQVAKIVSLLVYYLKNGDVLGMIKAIAKRLKRIKKEG